MERGDLLKQQVIGDAIAYLGNLKGLEGKLNWRVVLCRRKVCFGSLKDQQMSEGFLCLQEVE